MIRSKGFWFQIKWGHFQLSRASKIFLQYCIQSPYPVTLKYFWLLESTELKVRYIAPKSTHPHISPLIHEILHYQFLQHGAYICRIFVCLFRCISCINGLIMALLCCIFTWISDVTPPEQYLVCMGNIDNLLLEDFLMKNLSAALDYDRGSLTL